MNRPINKLPFSKDEGDVTYRGCRLERVLEATNVGYAPQRHNRQTHTLTNRTRKTSGWIIDWPQEFGGGTAQADTLAQAKKRVDTYLE